nr:enoyl-CoA hydratase/isomerase family protein [Mangrovicella endophytica]
MPLDRLFGIEGHGVRVEADGHVARLVLARPAKLNALDLDMLAALDAALDAIDAEAALAAMLILGEGRGFCAGGDITAWSGMTPAAFAEDWVRRGHRVFDRLARSRLPTIAVLDGHALGGGLEFAACADFRVAERHIKVGLPETSIGVVPGWSGTQRAVRRFGAQIVRRMAIGGDVLTADEALAAGLVDRVVDTGSGAVAATQWAERIAARSPAATRVAKALLSIAEGEETAGAAEALASAFIATTADCAEGVESFRAKRPPAFTGA